jgi:fructose-1,6-bisphosphatase/inositol monophosphatase family enzyme
MYVKLLKEWFPGFGIIAEEAELSMPCTLQGSDLYFTVDPLDGTKAFGRRQSTGVGTMLALVCNGKVIAAYVGDVISGEVFGYRPESHKTHWIMKSQMSVPLGPDLNKPITEQYVVLRDPIEEHTKQMRALVKPGKKFKSYEIGGGSIGIMFTRLWRGEIGGIVLRPSWETPWDITPVFGITRRLGYNFYEFGAGGKLRVARMPLEKKKVRRDKEAIVIHHRFVF